MKSTFLVPCFLYFIYSLEYTSSLLLLKLSQTVHKYNRLHHSAQLISSSLALSSTNNIDIDDLFNNHGIKKTIIQPSRFKSNSPKNFPKLNDVVEIIFKIYRSDGVLAYDSLNRDRLNSDSNMQNIGDIANIENLDDDTKESMIFEFKVGQSPSEVIPGWEIAIKTMSVGEIASFRIPPKYAFGASGLPPPISIGPNESIVTQIHLLRIVPALSTRYKSVGVNESISDELVPHIEENKVSYMSDGDRALDKAQKERKRSSDAAAATTAASDINFQSVSATVASTPSSSTPWQPQQQAATASAGTDTAANSNLKDFKLFDPSRDKLDPNQRVAGRGVGHSWEENYNTIDIKIPIAIPLSSQSASGSQAEGLSSGWGSNDIVNPVRKSDLNIDITSTSFSVKTASGDSILSGPLCGKVLASESTWAIINPDDQSVTAAGTATAYIPVSPPVDSVALSEHDSVYASTPYLLLSLIKGYGHQDIWASVFTKDHIKSMNSHPNNRPSKDDGEDLSVHYQ